MLTDDNKPIYRDYVPGAWREKEPSRLKSLVGAILFGILLFAIVFGLFSCKPEVVKPEKRTALSVSVLCDNKKELHIRYPDSNLVYHDTNTNFHIFLYVGGYKSGSISITAYTTDSSNVSIEIGKKGSAEVYAKKNAAGKQTLSYTIP